MFLKQHHLLARPLKLTLTQLIQSNVYSSGVCVVKSSWNIILFYFFEIFLSAGQHYQVESWQLIRWDFGSLLEDWCQPLRKMIQLFTLAMMKSREMKEFIHWSRRLRETHCSVEMYLSSELKIWEGFILKCNLLYFMGKRKLENIENKPIEWMNEGLISKAAEILFWDFCAYYRVLFRRRCLCCTRVILNEKCIHERRKKTKNLLLRNCCLNKNEKLNELAAAALMINRDSMLYDKKVGLETRENGGNQRKYRKEWQIIRGLATAPLQNSKF